LKKNKIKEAISDALAVDGIHALVAQLTFIVLLGTLISNVFLVVDAYYDDDFSLKDIWQYYFFTKKGKRRVYGYSVCLLIFLSYIIRLRLSKLKKKKKKKKKI